MPEVNSRYMSNIDHIIEERAARIGPFIVGRLLPFKEKRSIGPFVFIDHMGPVSMDDDTNLDIGPHPHIGLSTLTYLFEGAIMHRDSLGTRQEIKPGAVNWMTAGKGVVHSERTPDYLRNQNKFLHGLQIWVALPKNMEHTDPSFHHIPAKDLPQWEEDGVHYKLIAGEIDNKISPVPVHTNLYMIEIKAHEKATINIGHQLYGESGLYIMKGQVNAENETYGERQILMTYRGDLCTFDIEKDTIVYIFGGEPFPEKRHMYWNFVSSDKAVIEKAVKDWQDKKMPTIPDDDDYVPLPKHNLKVK